MHSRQYIIDLFCLQHCLFYVHKTTNCKQRDRNWNAIVKMLQYSHSCHLNFHSHPTPILCNIYQSHGNPMGANRFPFSCTPLQQRQLRVFNWRFNIIYGFDDLRFQNVFRYGHSGRGHWVPRRQVRRFELLQPSHATEFLSVCDDLKLQRVKHFTSLTDNRGFATLYLYNIKLISALVRLRGAPTAR